MRYLDRISGPFHVHIGESEKDQRHAALAAVVLPVTFHRRNLRRLVLEGIEPMGIADDHLQRRGDEQHPHGHGEHSFDGGLAISPEQVPCP
ncbi:hypothetical protein D3C87_1944260 [compost metagenome]